MLSIPAIASIDGREHTIFVSGDAAQAYVLLWLLNPALHYGSLVRRCALGTCNNFLLTTTGKAGPPRKFCSEVHAKDFDKIKARERAQKWREQHQLGTRKGKHK